MHIFSRHRLALSALIILFGSVLASGAAAQIAVSSTVTAPMAASANALLASLKGDNRTDNQQTFNQLLSMASRYGFPVTLPNGVFRHSGVLLVRGITLQGQGPGTVLQGITRDQAAVALDGTGSTLQNLGIRFNATTRSNNPQSSGVLVWNKAVNFTIRNVVINGGDGTGIIVKSGTQGLIEGNTVNNTLADAIHITGGSSNITVRGNTTNRSGDDGIAVVSYEDDYKVTEGIRVVDNHVLDNVRARGLSVVGGRDIQLENNEVRCSTSPHAGIYIASEASYRTFGVTNVSVSGNRVTHCGSAQSGQGSIMVYRGYRDNLGVLVMNNTVTDAPVQAIHVRGFGNSGVRIVSNTIINPVGAPLALETVDQPVLISGNTVQGSTVNAVQFARTVPEMLISNTVPALLPLAR